MPKSYFDRLRKLHDSLGIPKEYLDSCKLPLCLEPASLKETELDFYDRPQRLTPNALTAWTSMKDAASREGCVIFLISAFRDLEYQYDVIARKVDQGRSLEEVLRVNAAPGYSEHHTGRAIDIGTVNCDALIEEFDKTPAFLWLERNAAQFGFVMTYPKKNASQIDYEPWHWCFQEAEN